MVSGEQAAGGKPRIKSEVFTILKPVVNATGFIFYQLQIYPACCKTQSIAAD